VPVTRARIRAATTADLAELSRIKSTVSRRVYGALMSESELAWWLDVGCSPERFATPLRDPRSTVLIDDDAHAVGTVTCAEAAYISDVYVERAGRGAGRRMVDALLAAARDAGLAQAECSVMAWSEDAIAFWERMGFRRGRFLTRPVFDPEGLMRRDGEMQSETFPTRYLGFVRAQ
jgi:ribosomal protein S18 acetylase RimI-like enzyme